MKNARVFYSYYSRVWSRKNFFYLSIRRSDKIFSNVRISYITWFLKTKLCVKLVCGKYKLSLCNHY